MQLSAELVISGTSEDGSGFVPITRTISTTAPLTGGGDLSADRTIGITQATGGTDGYLSAVDWTIFNAKMSNVMNQLGDIIYGGAAGTPTRLGIGAAGTVLHGGTTPSYSAVVEGDISLSAISTNDATVLRHGFLPPLSGNTNQFLDGGGNWSTPSGGVQAAYTSVTFTNQTSVTLIHNFGAYPVVQVFDGTGAVLIPLSIVNTSINQFTVTFAVSTSGTIVATVGSPQAQNVVVTGSDYAITTANRIVQVTVAGKTVTLPTAIGIDGSEFIIDNSSTGNITLAPQAGETVEGESSQNIPRDSAIHVYSDGTAWRIY